MTSPYRHVVRSYEVDHQGVLFNGRYLEIADAAMTDFFEQLGFNYPNLIEAGMDPSVVAIDMSFQAPARLGDHLAVKVTVGRLGRTSLLLHFAFDAGEASTATVSTTYVNVTEGVSQATPIPAVIRARLDDETHLEEKP